jgi:tRNA pseudouridine38-40 synthase
LSYPLKKYFYLINIQFLGFRYSGWQKQPNAKTVQGMVDKTFFCIFGHENFKTLGAGRTDAKVSANQFALELFVSEKLVEDELLIKLNKNLPPDIKALDISEVDKKFNVINDVKMKEYYYAFSFHERIHPYSTPFMVFFDGQLNIELMKEGARLFEGKHNFKNYCYKPNPDTEFFREIKYCEIVENSILKGDFFPKNSWAFHVHGTGFMRHQIRLMMGALVNLGKGEVTLDSIKDSLINGQGEGFDFIAPSSGLVLNSVNYFL